jgi:hypothetical protein
MQKLLQYVSQQKNAKVTNNGISQRVAVMDLPDFSPVEEELLRFTDKEKEEIAQSLRIILNPNTSKSTKQEIYSTFQIEEDVGEEELQAAKKLFMYREPEVGI